VGGVLPVVFIQTDLDSSHLESLKPAQREAEEDCRKRRPVRRKSEPNGEEGRG